MAPRSDLGWITCTDRGPADPGAGVQQITDKVIQRVLVFLHTRFDLSIVRSAAAL